MKMKAIVLYKGIVSKNEVGGKKGKR